MKELVRMTCPYCGNVFSVTVEKHFYPQVVLCDTEDTDGCDRWFVVTMMWVPEVTYYKMEIIQ